MPFQPAKKLQTKLKIALYGPSGSGKTMGSLKIAKGLVGPKGRIAVIDSETGSSSSYAKKHADFDISILKSFTPDDYIRELKEAVKENYDIIIIDSITHEWNAILESVEASETKNKYTAWRGPSSDHVRFMTAILQTPVHMIVTMRQKDKIEMIKNEKGQMEPLKIGVKPNQREDVPYEFTTVFHIDNKHIATTEKDRTEMFDGFNDPLTEQVGAQFKEWLEEGDLSAAYKRAPQEKKSRVHLMLTKMQLSYENPAVKAKLQGFTGKESMTFWSEADVDLVIEKLESAMKETNEKLKAKSKPKETPAPTEATETTKENAA